MNAIYIGLPVAVASVVSMNISMKRVNPWIPPGPVVGAIWIVLLALLGHAASIADTVTSAAIVSYIAFCIAYPFIARSDRIARTLNALALIFAACLIAFTHADRTFVMPVAAWTAYVNIVDNLA